VHHGREDVASRVVSASPRFHHDRSQKRDDHRQRHAPHAKADSISVRTIHIER
jgi:hypothetical protein